MKKTIKKHYQELIGLFLWGTILGFFYHYKIVNNLSFLDLAKTIYSFLTKTPLGILIFIFLYILRSLLLFPLIIFNVLAGTLYGVWNGLFFATIGTLISAILSYFMGRFFSKNIMPNKKQRNLSPFLTVIILRLIYMPFDIVNYTCSLLKIPLKTFIIATTIGILPSITAYVLFGSSIQNIESFNSAEITTNKPLLISSILIVIGCTIIAIILKKKKKYTQ